MFIPGVGSLVSNVFDSFIDSVPGGRVVRDVADNVFGDNPGISFEDQMQNRTVNTEEQIGDLINDTGNSLATSVAGAGAQKLTADVESGIDLKKISDDTRRETSKAIAEGNRDFVLSLFT